METNKELTERHARVKEEYNKAKAQAERCKLGSALRSRLMKWAGSLNFTLLGIESDMRERGLTVHP